MIVDSLHLKHLRNVKSFKSNLTNLQLKLEVVFCNKSRQSFLIDIMIYKMQMEKTNVQYVAIKHTNTIQIQ